MKRRRCGAGAGWSRRCCRAEPQRRRPPLRLRRHGRQPRRRCSATTALNPGMLWVLRRRAAPGRARRARPAAPAPAATATRAHRCAAWPPATRPSTRRCGGRSTCASASTPCRAAPAAGPRRPPRAEAALALEAYVAHAVARPADRAAGRPAAGSRPRERGRALFDQRMGQLDLACADCHDAAGRPAPGRQPDPAGPPHRLPDLPAGVAGPGLAAAPAARLPERACAPSPLPRRAGMDRTGAVPGLARRGMPLETPAVRPLRRPPLR